jgi:hypothetical protein
MSAKKIPRHDRTQSPHRIARRLDYPPVTRASRKREIDDIGAMALTAGAMDDTGPEKSSSWAAPATGKGNLIDIAPTGLEDVNVRGARGQGFDLDDGG